MYNFNVKFVNVVSPWCDIILVHPHSNIKHSGSSWCDKTLAHSHSNIKHSGSSWCDITLAHFHGIIKHSGSPCRESNLFQLKFNAVMLPRRACKLLRERIRLCDTSNTRRELRNCRLFTSSKRLCRKLSRSTRGISFC